MALPRCVICGRAFRPAADGDQKRCAYHAGQPGQATGATNAGAIPAQPAAAAGQDVIEGGRVVSWRRERALRAAQLLAKKTAAIENG